MVHVLRELHRALKPTGILLDIHPMPRLRRVEVHRAGRAEPVGEFDDGVQKVADAEAQLGRVLDSGLFEVEEHREFDMLERHESVRALRAHERETGNEPMPDDLAERASAAMRPGDELVLLERIRATRLRRIDAPAPASRPGADP